MFSDGAGRSSRGWAHAYRTPLYLTALFVVLLGIFAVTPDPNTATGAAEPTSEPTLGPRECVVCPIDQECDPKSGQCMFVDHTPLPCVRSAKFDEKAGFCLPTGAPPAPAASTPDREPDSGDEPAGRTSREPRQPDLPGFGSNNDDDDD